MELTSFGGILGFALELEEKDESFYASVLNAMDDDAKKEVIQSIIKTLSKNQKTIQRVRRENVTEMILEGIEGFSKTPFLKEFDNSEKKTPEDALTKARELENRAIEYYLEAAEKIKTLAEVARELKQLSKKRKKNLEALSGI